MKARPILFSGPMVRALREGRKTQTRRPVKPQPSMREVAGVCEMLTFTKRKGGGYWLYPNAKEQVIADCPYGMPGDLLWVRETWGVSSSYDGVPPREIKGAKVVYASSGGMVGVKLRPSIHMPRWASRFTLRITSVRVERVQDISNEDAVAEGIGTPPDMRFAAHDNFRPLWDRINAARGFGWNANPWVWALTFEVIHANVDRVLATLGDAA